MYYHWGWRPYVSAAERRLQALRKIEKLRKTGHTVSPVVIAGRAIAKTFWGKAWCDNLERYSDFASRLPRGRTYARNGSVIDLQMTAGEIKALVSGSNIYSVAVKVAPVTRARWKSICKDCAGAIDSVVELLQGRFSQGVMARICRQKTGLFPSPGEIEFSCSCPDWAGMCKHVAAVLYGVGARLDQQPELLFSLHKVDEKELIAKAGEALPLVKKGPAAGKIFAGEDLSELFGLDMAPSSVAAKSSPQLATWKSKSGKTIAAKTTALSPDKKKRAARAVKKDGWGTLASAKIDTGEGAAPEYETRTMNTKKREQKVKARDDARKRPHLSHDKRGWPTNWE